jgi:hypothetical protein
MPLVLLDNEVDENVENVHPQDLFALPMISLPDFLAVFLLHSAVVPTQGRNNTSGKFRLKNKSCIVGQAHKDHCGFALE